MQTNRSNYRLESKFGNVWSLHAWHTNLKTARAWLRYYSRQTPKDGWRIVKVTYTLVETSDE